MSGSMIWAKPILARCGNSRIVLQPRAHFQHGDGVQVRDKEGHVRIAHADGGGSPGRSSRSVSIGRARGISVQSRRAGAHIDLDQAVRTADRRQVAGDGADGDRGAVQLSRIRMSATQRVALPQAPAREPSGLVDAHEGVGGPGRLDDDDLVAADPGVPVRRWRRHGPGVRPSGTRTLVEDDEVVAAAMHLHERGGHGAHMRELRFRAMSPERVGPEQSVAAVSAVEPRGRIIKPFGALRSRPRSQSAGKFAVSVRSRPNTVPANWRSRCSSTFTMATGALVRLRGRGLISNYKSKVSACEWRNQAGNRGRAHMGLGEGSAGTAEVMVLCSSSAEACVIIENSITSMLSETPHLAGLYDVPVMSAGGEISRRQPGELSAGLRRAMAATPCRSDRLDLIMAREVLARICSGTSPCEEPSCL